MHQKTSAVSRRGRPRGARRGHRVPWRGAGAGALRPASGETAAPASIANATYVGRAQCARCHQAEDEGSGRGRTTTSRCRRPTPATVLGNFANATLHVRRHHDALQRARRQVRRAHRRTGRSGPGLRRGVRVRRLPAAAVPDRLPGRPVPGPQRRLGCTPEGRGRPALVPPVPGREGHAHRRPALDEVQPELECPVRHLPFHQPAQGVRPRDQHLQDDVVGDRRVVRDVSRPGVGARGLGRHARHRARRRPATAADMGLTTSLRERRNVQWTMQMATGIAQRSPAPGDAARRGGDLRAVSRAPSPSGSTRTCLASHC